METTCRTVFLLMVCSGVSLLEILVYPKILESRADEEALLILINGTFALYLKKSYLLAKDFQVPLTNGTYSENVALYGADFEKDLYYNNEYFSSLAVRRLESGLEIQGILSSELRIMPVRGGELASEGAAPQKIFKVDERSDEESTPEPHPTRSETAEIAKEIITEPIVEKTNELTEMFIVELCFTTSEEYRKAFKKGEDLVIYAAIMVNSAREKQRRNERGGGLIFPDYGIPTVDGALN